MGEFFLHMVKQEASEMVRRFFLNTREKSKGGPQSDSPPPPGPEHLGGPAPDSLRYADTAARRRPGPALPSPSGLEAQEKAHPHAPGAGLSVGHSKEWLAQHWTTSEALADRWQTWRRPATPSFPAHRTCGRFAPSQLLSGTEPCYLQGDKAGAGRGKWRTPALP